ncbi:MAG: CBS domain-containing protein [bacterium]
MLVRDVMTYNVITVPSTIPVFEAERLLESHKFERLPVVDKGKLVGLVTKDTLLKASPSSATSLSRGELLYVLSKLTVKEIMKKNVVTITPDTTIERATKIAQEKRVGCLIAVEDEKVVGILTTNDIFYKVINPLFGIGEKGKRIIVYGAGEMDQMQKVFDCIKKAGFKMKSFWQPTGTEKKNLILQMETEDVGTLVSQLKKDGFSAEERS